VKSVTQRILPLGVTYFGDRGICAKRPRGSRRGVVGHSKTAAPSHFDAVANSHPISTQISSARCSSNIPIYLSEDLLFWRVLGCEVLHRYGGIFNPLCLMCNARAAVTSMGLSAPSFFENVVLLCRTEYTMVIIHQVVPEQPKGRTGYINPLVSEAVPCESSSLTLCARPLSIRLSQFVMPGSSPFTLRGLFVLALIGLVLCRTPVSTPS
jgi:hypothetical protein